jgi:hypothetical protein
MSISCCKSTLSPIYGMGGNKHDDIYVRNDLFMDDIYVRNDLFMRVIRIRISKKNRQHKEKVQKDKQLSTKHTRKTKDRVPRTPLKTGGQKCPLFTFTVSAEVRERSCSAMFFFHNKFLSPNFMETN